MTEMESPLEDYADGLGFHFDSYFIWQLLYRRIGDALTKYHIRVYPINKLLVFTNGYYLRIEWISN